MPPARKPPVDPAGTELDDATLFRAAIGPVREFEAVDAPPEPQRPAPEPRQREADERAALRQMRNAPFAIEAPDLLLYRRPEVAPRVLKRLRRGLYVVQDELDLHGLIAADAERLLRQFLADVRRSGALCVRLIHGKGLHAEHGEGPVLKALVERMLVQRRDVLAYASAPPAQGGSGAVLVLLGRSAPATGLSDRRDPEASAAD